MSDDFWFGDSKCIDSLTNTFDRHVEALGVVLPHRLLGHRYATLQIETERDFVSGREIADHRKEDDGDDADE